MDDSSLAISRRAAQRHALAVAAGPPRSPRWTAPSAAAAAVGAAVALPLLRPAALALAAVAVLLLAVHRQDRRDAWRYAPDPVAPARLLPPLRPPRGRRDAAAAAAPTVPAAPNADLPRLPARAVPRPRLPEPAAQPSPADR